MSVAAVRNAPGRMSGTEFRSFQEGRPDHERWELVGGVPVMMTPPLIEHNVIASNLEAVLNLALGGHDPTRIAVQRPGMEFRSTPEALSRLGLKGEYRPEPDVAVIGYEDAIAGKRFVNVAYLLAEIVSDSDEEFDRGAGGTWIDTKVALYRAHEPCEAVLVVRQDRVEVVVHRKSAGGWRLERRTELGAPLTLPSVGLSCTVADLYTNTRWRPRPGRVRQA